MGGIRAGLEIGRIHDNRIKFPFRIASIEEITPISRDAAVQDEILAADREAHFVAAIGQGRAAMPHVLLEERSQGEVTFIQREVDSPGRGQG